MKRFLSWTVACVMFLLACVSPVFAQSGAERDLAQRDQWQSQQKVLRQVIRVDVQRSTNVQTTWLLWERTPSGRIKIIASKDPASDPEFLFLQQGANVLVMIGEEADAPAAPWMLGFKLFDQPLEPSMLQSWSLGLPGTSFQMGAHPAEVTTDDNGLRLISQEGWTVRYNQWHDAQNGRPALPKSFRMCSPTLCANVATFINQADVIVPADYQEFSLM